MRPMSTALCGAPLAPASEFGRWQHHEINPLWQVDDGLCSICCDLAPDAATRKKILVDNAGAPLWVLRRSQLSKDEQMNRRCMIVLAAGMALLVPGASAQVSYPTKPIRVIVPEVVDPPPT